MPSNKQKGATKLVNCGQTSIPSDLRANRQLICGLCRVWGKVTEKRAGKKATDTTNTRNKAEENEKTELTGLKLIDLSGWNSLFLNIIQGCE